MMRSMRSLMGAIASTLKKLASRNENSCGRCGVCHHVCGMLKTSPQKSTKARED